MRGRGQRGMAITVLVLVLVVAGRAKEQQGAPIAGKWSGLVTTDIGQMHIEVTLAQKDGKVTGQIVNPHGTFKISQGKLVEGVWRLDFESEEGATGQMNGKVTGDNFAGDWDFHPMAVGTFALKRVV
jgi:hypothetical protein